MASLKIKLEFHEGPPKKLEYDFEPTILAIVHDEIGKNQTSVFLVGQLEGDVFVDDSSGNDTDYHRKDIYAWADVSEFIKLFTKEA